jgi:hypothetical protein
MQETELYEVAKALDILAKRGMLYGGFKRKLRRVVEVRATSTQLVVKYDDGGVYYIDRSLNRRFVVYTHPPQ